MIAASRESALQRLSSDHGSDRPGAGKLRRRRPLAKEDSGSRIDASGQLVDGTPMDGAERLRKALLSYPDAFVQTMTEKLLMYAVGRAAHYYDMPAVRTITREAARNDYRFSSLVLGIVNSEPFQIESHRRK